MATSPDDEVTSPTRQSPRRRLPPWPVIAVSLGVPLVLLAATDLIYLRVAPNEVYTGVFRRDLLYHLADAREAFENGNGLVYGLAWSQMASSARLYSRLLSLILGWCWHLSGIPLPVLWQSAQFVFGTLMFVALYHLLGCFFSGTSRTYAFLVIALGGGATAARALWWNVTDGGAASGGYLCHFLTVSLSGGPAWHPNVFQTALFTTESFYHMLAFLTFAAVIQHRLRWAFAGIVLLCWAHPFTAIEAAAIIGPYTLMEAAINRSRRLLGFALGVAALAMLLAAYYMVIIPQWSPEAAAILGQWRRPYFLTLSDAPLMWGIFLFGPLLFLHPAARGTGYFSDSRARFLGVWLLAVAALLLQDRIISHPIQPPHFSHGYFFVPLAIMTLRALSRLSARWRPRQLRVAAIILLLLVIPDNVMVVAREAMLSSRSSIWLGTACRPKAFAYARAMISTEAESALAYLAKREPPALVLVQPEAGSLAAYIPVMTHHRVYAVSPYLTPGYKMKLNQSRKLFASRTPASDAVDLGVTWIIGSARSLERIFRDDIKAGRARLAYSNALYGAIEVIKTPQEGSELNGG